MIYQDPGDCFTGNDEMERGTVMVVKILSLILGGGLLGVALIGIYVRWATSVEIPPIYKSIGLEWTATGPLALCLVCAAILLVLGIFK